MSKKMKQVLSMGLLCVVLSGTFVGCRPYDKPEFKKIEASQTAFLIPLEGKTSKQDKFMSEEFLEQSKIATKRIQIHHKWIKEGRNIVFEKGKHVATEELIVVERKPETREWTEQQTTGTSAKNEGIVAESKESIGFMARMNVSAQIEEVDASRFLYRYNNKKLSDVLDTEIRAKIESRFVEECSKRTLEDILLNKEQIMKSVRDFIIPYFKDNGVTITVVGLKGEFTYLNPSIQENIDAKFKAQKENEAQTIKNKTKIEQAQADSKAISIMEATMEKQIKLKELENQKAWIEKWDGKQPTTVLGSNSNTMIGLK